MKKTILKLEYMLTGFLPVAWSIRILDRLMRRFLWVWGRLRFSALVRQRGPGCVCHWNADLKYPHNIELGEGVVIGVNVSIGAHSRVRLGNRVRLSRDVMIETAGLDFAHLAPPYLHVSRPVVLEQGVWVGARAMILAGVTIGENSVVAAGAIVTRDVPPYSVVAGVPAKVVGSTKKEGAPKA